jgi:5-methylcytosine-specific restriction endonuclease McrA
MSSLMASEKGTKHGIGAVSSVPPRVNSRSKRKRLYIYERDNYTCKLCGRKLTYETATLDHVIPRSKGGSGAINNLVTACAPCNREKDDKMMRDYGYEWNHWTYEWEKHGST